MSHSERELFAAGHRQPYKRGDFTRGIQCRRAGDKCPPDASHAFADGWRCEDRRHVGRFWTVPAKAVYTRPTLTRRGD